MDRFLSRIGLVAPLEFTQGLFLQVLLNRFTLKRNSSGIGVELDVAFDGDTPAIWSRQAKNDIRVLIPDFQAKSAHYQEQLDEFLLKNKKSKFVFADDTFYFRYASAGTLPILRMGDREYYCLFYRDVFPTGWNIANGSCDTQQELFNPVQAIERELREELLILDIKKRKRYVFDWDAGKSHDLPEFGVARRFWKERFRSLNVPEYKEIEIPLKWFTGPDSIRVRYKGRLSNTVRDCFLNINGRDFGIEIDKIAKINVDQDVTLLDGELIGGQLENRIVGLFPVETLTSKALENQKRFIPEMFFFDGNAYNGTRLDKTIAQEFLPHVAPIRTSADRLLFANTENKFDLCPVTRRIIHRYLAATTKSSRQRRARGTTSRKPSYDAFISFHGKDKIVARKVYEFLRDKHKLNVFFSEENTDPDFIPRIEEALNSANIFITVGTDPKHLRKNFPAFEARTFHMMMLNGRKPKTARLVSFISFDPKKLPTPNLVYHAVSFRKTNTRTKLEELAKYVTGRQDHNHLV